MGKIQLAQFGGCPSKSNKAKKDERFKGIYRGIITMTGNAILEGK